jgi:Zn-dependent peptidase ImmA (M78 family)/transcriptional regulator with XRE-family HTH domain
MITGERVKQARELRGLTQAELANKVEMSQPFIAQVEGGFAQPDDGTMDKLAEALQVAPGFFKQPPPVDFPLGSLLFRARATVTASERERAHRYAQLIFEIVQSMARDISGYEIKVPRLSGDPTTPLDAAQAARITRSSMGISPDTPIDSLIRTLERNGILVLELPISIEGIDAFAMWAGNVLFGLAATSTDLRKPVIVVSMAVPGDRLRFSVAHELGHLVMHQAPEGTLGQIEKESNMFAAEFLMPEAAMRLEMNAAITLADLARLKLQWGVSIQALLMRAHDLHIVSDRQYRNLYEQLGAYGWRTREPPNLDISVERPRFPRQVAEMVYGKPLNYEKIGEDIMLTAHDVQAIIGVYAGNGGQDPNNDDPDTGSGKILPFAKPG